MNRLYLVSWYYQGRDGETDARAFYAKLREGAEKGIQFPFDCPAQVALVSCSADPHWCVGVLVMRGTPGDDSVEQTDQLLQWFEACGADYTGTDRRGERVTRPSVEGTLQDIYGSQYAVKETFDPQALAVESEIQSKGSQAQVSAWDQLSPEMKAMAEDLICLADGSPDGRYNAYNVLAQKRYRDQEIQTCVSTVDSALPPEDMNRRARLYCGAGYWLGGNIHTRSQGEELLRHAIQLAPHWGLPHTLLGMLLMGESSNAFLEIGTTSRSNYPGLSNAELEALARSCHEQAIEQLKEAIRLAQDDATSGSDIAANYFAFTASKFLDYRVIKSRYQRGLQLDLSHSPEFAFNHWDFAMLASMQGFYQDALDAFLRARIVRPEKFGTGPGTLQPRSQPALSYWLIAHEMHTIYPTDDLWLMHQTIEIVPLPGEQAGVQRAISPIHELGHLKLSEQLALQDLYELHKGLQYKKKSAREQSRKWGKSVLLGLVWALMVLSIGFVINDAIIPNNAPSSSLLHTINTIAILVLIAGGFFAIFWTRYRRFSGWVFKAEAELWGRVSQIVQQEPALVERLGGRDALMDIKLVEGELQRKGPK